MSNSLQARLHKAAVKQEEDALALYDLLEEKKGPVCVADIKEKLGLTETAYKRACDLLLSGEIDLYVTGEGVVLKRFLPDEDDRRLWHLAWSLGLFRASGRQLKQDRDLLQLLPAAILKLGEQGRLKDQKKVNRLRSEARKNLGLLVDIMDMYKQVDKALGVVSLQEVKGKDWTQTLGKIKKEIAGLEPGH